MVRRRKTILALFVVALLLPGSSAAAQGRRRSVRAPSVPQDGIVRIADDFRFGDRGWTAGFCDYSPVSAPVMELDAGIRPLPPELGLDGTGFFISGHNRSDDLFMFLTKRLTAADGIEPNRQYLVTFRIVFASNAGTNCAGIGGSPGASVILRAGATGEEPQVVLVPEGLHGHYRLNVDKGDMAHDNGTATSPVGPIENGTPHCADDAPYVMLDRTHLHRHIATADAHGRLSLLVGTDSGFEGRTTLYYQRIEAIIEPVAPAGAIAAE